MELQKKDRDDRMNALNKDLKKKGLEVELINREYTLFGKEGNVIGSLIPGYKKERLNGYVVFYNMNCKVEGIWHCGEFKGPSIIKETHKNHISYQLRNSEKHECLYYEIDNNNNIIPNTMNIYDTYTRKKKEEYGAQECQNFRIIIENHIGYFKYLLLSKSFLTNVQVNNLQYNLFLYNKTEEELVQESQEDICGVFYSIDKDRTPDFKFIIEGFLTIDSAGENALQEDGMRFAVSNKPFHIRYFDDEDKCFKEVYGVNYDNENYKKHDFICVYIKNNQIHYEGKIDGANIASTDKQKVTDFINKINNQINKFIPEIFKSFDPCIRGFIGNERTAEYQKTKQKKLEKHQNVVQNQKNKTDTKVIENVNKKDEKLSSSQFTSYSQFINDPMIGYVTYITKKHADEELKKQQQEKNKKKQLGDG